MKRCRKLRCAAFALPLLLATAAPAATVVWGAVTLGPSYWPPSTHILASEISPGGAGILLEIVRGPRLKASLQATDITVGIRHWWFGRNTAPPWTQRPWRMPSIWAEMTRTRLARSKCHNRIFYLGFRLARGGADYTKYIYGWASLLWNGTDLVLVDSAAETDRSRHLCRHVQCDPRPRAVGARIAAGWCGVLTLHRRRAEGLTFPSAKPWRTALVEGLLTRPQFMLQNRGTGFQPVTRTGCPCPFPGSKFQLLMPESP